MTRLGEFRRLLLALFRILNIWLRLIPPLKKQEPKGLNGSISKGPVISWSNRPNLRLSVR